MKKYILPLITLLCVHFLLLFNLEFTAWPEMLSFPYLFLNGFNLYGDMVHAYPPLLTLMLSLIYKVFGLSVNSLQIFTWTTILLSDILIFINIKNLTKNIKYGFFGVLFYILVQPFLDGNMLWFDTALTLPVLLLIYYRKKPIVSGIILGASILIKQTAFFYIAAYLIYLLLGKEKIKSIISFFIPLLVLIITFISCLFFLGRFQEFYNWNFFYPLTYWTKYPSYEILSLTRRELLYVFLVIVPTITLFAKAFKTVVKQRGIFLVILIIAAGVMAVYPRFSFYHFQPVIAVSAVSFGIMLTRVKIKNILVPFYLILIFLFLSFPTGKRYWGGGVRFFGEDTVKITEEIVKEIGEGKNIYLLGPHSGFYLTSKTFPVKPWIDNFGWYFEIPGVQDEVIISWEKDPPQFILVQTPNIGKWYEIGVYQPQDIVSFISLNYNREKEIEPGLWLYKVKP